MSLLPAMQAGDAFVNKFSIHGTSFLSVRIRVHPRVKKKAFPRGKHGNAPNEKIPLASVSKTYLRRRREATSASAPSPASSPNADGSGTTPTFVMEIVVVIPSPGVVLP